MKILHSLAAERTVNHASEARLEQRGFKYASTAQHSSLHISETISQMVMVGQEFMFTGGVTHFETRLQPLRV